jgi:hypothetical protein
MFTIRQKPKDIMIQYYFFYLFKKVTTLFYVSIFITLKLSINIIQL